MHSRIFQVSAEPITEENHINEYRYDEYLVGKDAYDDQNGFKIDDNDEYFGITSLDNFVRNVEEGKTYYIGKTFDYNF